MCELVDIRVNCSTHWNFQQDSHLAVIQQQQGFSFGAQPPSQPQSNTPAKPSLFGNQGSTTPAAPPPANNTFSFGNSQSTTPSSGFGGFSGFGKPAENPSTPGAGGSGGLFGGNAGGSAFGSTQPSSQPSSTTPSTTPAAPSSGGFNLGAMGFGNTPKPEEKKEAPKPGGFTFGGLGMGSKPEEKKDDAPKPSLFGGGAFGKPEEKKEESKPSGSGGGGFSFGSGGFGKPDEKKDDAPKPAPSGGFSLSGSDKGKDKEKEKDDTSKPAGGFGFGGLGGLGAPKPAEAPKPATSGGFTFGGAPAKPSEEKKDDAAKASNPSQSNPSQPAKPTGGFSFGGTPAKPTEEKKDDAAKPAAPAAPAPGGFSSFKLGGENKDADKEKEKETKDPLSVSALGKSTPGNSTTTSNAVKASPTPSLLRNKTLDEITHRWTGELETQQKDFNKIGHEVKAWDGVLRQNAEQISRIYNQTVQAEQTQLGVDQSLDYIEAQQRELDVVLTRYEKETEELLDGGENVGLGVGVADNERTKSYTLAETVNDELDDLSRNLSTMIDEINLLSGGVGAKEETTKQEDVIGQIAAILNAHLSSLQWIDGTSNNLVERVKELDGVVGGIQTKKEYDGGLNKSSNALPRRGGFGMSLV
ncbi:Nucleoporin NSP1 [Wallemia ichthyophaga EXF-994]|uniref:Nucleoporin NSP1 n=1 Tax=Wallemia ichthyophaga (strain EXF-994 / CBS 113033) TaxID=1299270 RepID=R9APU4_WALI9|nr:Nucleoporin NSP1 [Wallemia ichthyophaga EXF-994]EOR02121.1 Nucleoporin NSP1 [Wallemia ichthyophaga EXF-994]